MTAATGRQLGVLKTAAKRLGLSLEEYLSRKDLGMKCCWQCHEWKPLSAFSLDIHRADQRKAKCLACSRVAIRRKRRLGRPSVTVGNQASEAVRLAIQRGKLAPIETQNCQRCGYKAEHYHHHIGYAKQHWLDVMPLCISCHQREHYE